MTKIIDAPPMPMQAPAMPKAVLQGEPLELAENCTITCDRDNLIAGEQLTLIKGLQKEVEAGYKDLVSEAHNHHKAAKAKMDSFLNPLKKAEKIFKEKLGEYGAAKDSQAKGISIKKQFKAEIVDLDSIPDDLLEYKPNLKAIEAILNAGGSVPGVKPIESVTVSARAI